MEVLPSTFKGFMGFHGNITGILNHRWEIPKLHWHDSLEALGCYNIRGTSSHGAKSEDLLKLQRLRGDLQQGHHIF